MELNLKEYLRTERLEGPRAHQLVSRSQYPNLMVMGWRLNDGEKILERRVPWILHPMLEKTQLKSTTILGINSTISMTLPSRLLAARTPWTWKLRRQ